MGSGPSRAGTAGSEKGDGKGKALLKTLSGHTGGINCMDVSSNFAYLLTGSDDRTARVWDMVTYENKVVLEGHAGYISCCKIWQDRFALTGSVDKTVRKWNIFSGNCVLKMELHKGIINRLLYHGNFLFSTSYDRTIVCWNIDSGQAVRVFRGHKQSILPITYVKTAEHDPNGGENIDKNKDALITGSMDCTAKIWSINSGTSLRTFRGHKGAILCIAIDENKNNFYTGSTDFTIKKWNIQSGTILKNYKGHEGSVICLETTQKLLYSASVDCTARCWVAEFGDTTRKYSGHDHMISSMKYFSGLVITGSGDNTVKVFDAKSGTVKRTFKGHKHAVNCILPIQNMILSGSYDGNVKVWNIRDLLRNRLGDLEGSSSSVASSSLSVGGGRLTQEDGRSLTQSNVSMKDESEMPRTRRRANANNHLAESRVPDVNTNGYTKEVTSGFRETPNQSREEQQQQQHWLENEKGLRNVQAVKTSNQRRQNGKRRGVKSSGNKVAPASFTQNGQGKKNHNANNNSSNVVDDDDDASDLDEFLEEEMSDYSEGYNSRRGSESRFPNRAEKEHANDSAGSQRVNNNTWNKAQRKAKPLKPRSSKSSLLSYDSRVSSRISTTSDYSSRLKYSDDADNFNHKRDTSDLSRKRAKTDSSQTRNKEGIPARTMSPADLALVDEEMRMIAVETESTSTGYHSDKSSPQSPTDAEPVKPVGADRPPISSGVKSRTKSPATSISIDNQRAKALLKSSSRSSLWAPCSNSMENTPDGQSVGSRDVNITSPKKPRAKGNKVVLTKTESERLENEILHMT